MSGHHWLIMRISGEGTLDHAFELAPSFVPVDRADVPRFLVPAVMLAALLHDGHASHFRSVLALDGGER